MRALPLILAVLCFLPEIPASTMAAAPSITWTTVGPKQTGAIPLPVRARPQTKLPEQRERWAKVGTQAVFVRNVTQPTLLPFLPNKSVATGAAVIILPGGGFMMLSIKNEGWTAARWLAKHGVAAFVLKYRTAIIPDDKKFLTMLTAMSARDASNEVRGRAPVFPTHLAADDTEQALRLVRTHAKEWNIDPHRIGLLGFSAGAETVLRVITGTTFDAQPDFAASIYGETRSVKVPREAPPLFVALAADDPYHGLDGFGLIEAWRKAGRPIELHYFTSGGHGFGMLQTPSSSTHWVDEYYWWLKASGFLTPKEH